jgi:hypothetical protein
LRHHLTSRGMSGALKSIAAALNHRCEGFALPGADRAAVEAGWRHVVGFHLAYEANLERKSGGHALFSELLATEGLETKEAGTP